MFPVLCGSLFASLRFLTDTSKMSEPAKMSPELAFLLEREKIEEAIVEQFVAAGILTLKHFACLVPDREGLRKLAVTSFGLSDGDLIGMG